MKTLIAIALLAINLTSNMFGIGMRHDVEASEYRKLASNTGKYKASQKVPSFEAVCAVMDPNTEEVVGSGTLVSGKWVLTAAHVVVEAKRGKSFIKGLTVRFGDDSQSGYKEYKVKRILTPLDVGKRAYVPFGDLSRYFSQKREENAYFHDIALIELSEPVAGIKPMPVAWTLPKQGQSMFLAGFGNTAKGDVTKESLHTESRYKHAAQNVIDRVQTKQPRSGRNSGGVLLFDFDNGKFKRNTLQISRVTKNLRGFGLGKSDATPKKLEGACYPGDSGGPAIAKINGVWKVVGVSSYGTGFPVSVKRENDLQYGEILSYTLTSPHKQFLRKITSHDKK